MRKVFLPAMRFPTSVWMGAVFILRSVIYSLRPLTIGVGIHLTPCGLLFGIQKVAIRLFIPQEKTIGTLLLAWKIRPAMLPWLPPKWHLQFYAVSYNLLSRIPLWLFPKAFYTRCSRVSGQPLIQQHHTPQ